MRKPSLSFVWISYKERGKETINNVSTSTAQKMLFSSKLSK